MPFRRGARERAFGGLILAATGHGCLCLCLCLSSCLARRAYLNHFSSTLALKVDLNNPGRRMMAKTEDVLTAVCVVFSFDTHRTFFFFSLFCPFVAWSLLKNSRTNPACFALHVAPVDKDIDRSDLWLETDLVRARSMISLGSKTLFFLSTR